MKQYMINAKFGELAEQSIENVENKRGKVIQINADAAYDSSESFRISEEYNIKPVIKARKSPTTRSKNLRKKYAKEFHELGYENGRIDMNMVRDASSRCKRKFGEFVRATKKENMYHEAKLKYIFYNNAMIYYDMTGIPIWKNRNCIIIVKLDKGGSGYTIQHVSTNCLLFFL